MIEQIHFYFGFFLAMFFFGVRGFMSYLHTKIYSLRRNERYMGFLLEYRWPIRADQKSYFSYFESAAGLVTDDELVAKYIKTHNNLVRVHYLALILVIVYTLSFAVYFF